MSCKPAAVICETNKHGNEGCGKRHAPTTCREAENSLNISQKFRKTFANCNKCATSAAVAAAAAA